jgi:DNA replication protein DnaC
MDEFLKILGVDSDKLKTDAKNRRRDEGIGCSICDFSGYIKKEDNKTSMCVCLKDQYFKELFIKANVPNLYIGKSVDDWDTRIDSRGNELGAEQKISEWVFTLIKAYDKKLRAIVSGNSPKIIHSFNKEDFLHSLIFEGNIGSGKTFIASVLVQSAIRKGLTAKFYDWTDITTTISDFDKKDVIDSYLDEFRNLDFIAIDAVEHYSFMPNHAIPLLDRIFKSRLNSGKPTIIMTSPNYININGGSGWNSFLRNCLAVKLPNARR